MQMHLSSDVQIPDGLLAANALLAENSRQGFETYSGTVQQGFEVAISSTSLGISNPLYDGRVRSRCTGKERDTESGLDYFEARYYGSSMGRFMSPDPTGLQYADIKNPQSFNLYSYVRNNPLMYIDPTGKECVWDDGSYDSNDDKDTSGVDQSGSHTGCSGQGGTWVNNMAEWSSQANQTLADMLTPSSTVTAPDDWSLFDAASDTLNNVQQNGFYLNGIENYTTADVFNWAATGNHRPNGCASGVVGCVYHHGNYCGAGGSGAPVDGTDASCMVHDFLYAKYNFTVGDNFKGYNPALQEINQGLCNTAGNGPISAYFGSIVSGGNLLMVTGPGNPSCK
jgi:RHS repeat-associated protein